MIGRSCRCAVVVGMLLMVAGGTGLAVPPPSTGAGIVAREGIGGRALGLGGAFSALADDTTAGYFDPAGLAMLSGIHLGGMYESKFAPGTSFQYLSATYNQVQIGLGTGITLVRRSDSGIPYEGGTFEASDSLWLLSLGYDLGRVLSVRAPSRLAVGMNLKVYSSVGLGERKATGAGLDFGALFHGQFDSWVLSLGYVSLDTLGSTIRWQGTLADITETAPWIHRLAVAIELQALHLTLAGDMELCFAEGDLNRLHLGGEYVLGGFALRAGLGGRTPSVGLGVEILNGISLDLAVVFHGALGQSYVLSTEFSF